MDYGPVSAPYTCRRHFDNVPFIGVWSTSSSEGTWGSCPADALEIPM